MENIPHFTLRFLHVRQPLLLPPIVIKDYHDRLFAISFLHEFGKRHHNKASITYTFPS